MAELLGLIFKGTVLLFLVPPLAILSVMAVCAVFGLATIQLGLTRFAAGEKFNYFLLYGANICLELFKVVVDSEKKIVAYAFHGLQKLIGPILKLPILNYIEPIFKMALRGVFNRIQSIYHLVKYTTLRLRVVLFKNTPYDYNLDRSITPILKYAAQKGYLERIKFLHKHGVNVHQDDVLYFAVKNKHSDIVKFLLSGDPYSLTRGAAFRMELLETAVLGNDLGIIKDLLNAMTKSELDYAGKYSDVVHMSSAVHNYRFAKLAWPLFQNTTTFLMLMAQTNMMPVSALIPNQIMPMISVKPEWCPDKVYTAFCEKILTKAQMRLAEKVKNSVLAPAMPHQIAVDVLPPAAPEPVTFVQGPRPVKNSLPATAANDVLLSEASRKASM